jgi:hypothetical protein
VAVGQGSDRVAAFLGSLAGEAAGKGADPTERGVAEGKSQKILNAGPMLYTVPGNFPSNGVCASCRARCG